MLNCAVECFVFLTCYFSYLLLDGEKKRLRYCCFRRNKWQKCRSWQNIKLLCLTGIWILYLEEHYRGLVEATEFGWDHNKWKAWWFRWREVKDIGKKRAVSTIRLATTSKINDFFFIIIGKRIIDNSN